MMKTREQIISYIKEQMRESIPWEIPNKVADMIGEAFGIIAAVVWDFREKQVQDQADEIAKLKAELEQVKKERDTALDLMMTFSKETQRLHIELFKANTDLGQPSKTSPSSDASCSTKERGSETK